MLDLLDACVQALGCVAVEYSYALLRENRPAVNAFVDEMHGLTGLGHAGLELILDRMRAGKLGQERRMDVHHGVREAVEKCGREQVHVTGEYDDADPLPLEPVGHRGI